MTRPFLCCAAILPLITAAHAAAPTVGDVLRETAPPPQMAPEGRLPPLDVPAAEVRPMPGDAGLQVTPRYFRISGASVFVQAELQALLIDLIGRETGYAGLREAADRITRYYRDHGYLLARAWLPTQKLAAGVVEIAVLEGRLGDVRLVNQSSYSDADIAAFLDPNSLTGQVAERRLLERKLLLLADIPGFTVKAELVPGTSVGSTDLNVEVGGAPRVQGDISFDNHGNGYSGRYRFGGGLRVVNPGGWGDVVSLRGLLSHDGLAYGRLAYQSAVGREGTRLGAAVSVLRYSLGRDFGHLGAEGDADVVGINALHPLLRGVDRNLNLSLAWEETQLSDRIISTGGISDKRKQTLTVSLTGHWNGRGTGNSVALSLTGGDLELQSDTVAAQDALTARSAGNFSRLNLEWSQLRLLTGGYTLNFHLRGQVAGKNLDASEKLGLGGSNGVRAFPQGEAAGDDAFLASVEARRLLGRVGAGVPLHGTLFADFGSSRINHRDWSGGTNTRSLSGMGASLDWGLRESGITRVGFAVKTSGGVATSDKDSRTRLWISYEEAF